jgi:hypothetical protein
MKIINKEIRILFEDKISKVSKLQLERMEKPDCYRVREIAEGIRHQYEETHLLKHLLHVKQKQYMGRSRLCYNKISSGSS